MFELATFLLICFFAGFCVGMSLPGVQRWHIRNLCVHDFRELRGGYAYCLKCHEKGPKFL